MAVTTRARWLRRLALGVLIIATVVIAGRAVLHLSYFRVQKVDITGLEHETRADVFAVTGLGTHPPMVDLNNSQLAADVETLPWVAVASVHETWPQTVDIAVTPEVPVAVARGAHGQLDEVSGDGRLITTVSVSTSLPLLVAAGSTTTTPWPFATWARPAARVASELPVAFATQVAVITITRDDDVRFTLTSPLTIDLGTPTNLGAKFAAIAAVLARPDLLHTGDVVDVSVPGSPTVSGPP